MSILELSALSKTFHTMGHEVYALRDVSLVINKGSCFAIVGESGSGKSTLANLILGIYPATSGKILLNEKDLPPRRSLALRRSLQLVQQNPLSSLNPRRSVGASIRLALDVHDLGERADRPARVRELLEEVGLPASFYSRSPVTLSGGQRQRVAIARALACEPQLIVLDEPTSALDVLVQARVLRLLGEIRRSRDLTYLFITHDLAVVRNIADQVAVFEQGRIVESGPVEKIFSDPNHAYTRRLIAAIPVVDADEEWLRHSLTGDRNDNDDRG